MDCMNIDTMIESRLDTLHILPAEIWLQIVSYFAVYDLPFILPSCKYFNNLITVKTKRSLIAKLKSDYDLEQYKRIKKQFSEHFLKLAIHYNDASHMDEFLTEEIRPWNIVALTFVPEQRLRTYSVTPRLPTFREKYFEEMLKSNATNVLEWMMLQFDNIEPEALGFSLRKDGSFQLFLLCLMKSLLNTEETIRKLQIFDQAMKIIEKYNDMLIRITILASARFNIAPNLSNVPSKIRLDSYACDKYDIDKLLSHDPVKYLQFLIYIHVTYDQYNFNFDTATAEVFENDTNKELFALPQLSLALALMMTPLELAYYMNENTMVDEILKVSPADKTRAYIGWIIANGSDAENRFLNQSTKYANINSKFSPGIQTLLHSIYHKPIETALGMAVLRIAKPARMLTIEWLLSNGAKFSENEKSFINRGDNLNAKKVLVASEIPKYCTMKNTLDGEVDFKQRAMTFRPCPKKKSNRGQVELIVRPDGTFSKFMKGVEYQGKWEVTDGQLICKSTIYVKRLFFGGSYGGFTDEKYNDTTEFKFKILMTCYDDPVLIEAGSKSKTGTFNNLTKLYWCM